MSNLIALTSIGVGIVLFVLAMLGAYIINIDFHAFLLFKAWPALVSVLFFISVVREIRR